MAVRDRRGPRRQAHLRHRVHRLPGHRPGRAPAAGRARLPRHPAGPPGRRARRPPSGPGGRCSATTPSTSAGRSSAAPGPSTSLLDRRVDVVAGDVGLDGLGLDDDGRAGARPPPTWSIHSAAMVSFDSPLDRAVEVNLLGPSRLADALRASSTATPHCVAVSTCYVAGSRRGSADRGAGRRLAVLRRGRLAGRGGRRPAPAGRGRRREPHPGPAPALPQGGPHRAGRGRAGRSWPRRPSSSASAGSTTAWSRRAGPGPPRSATPTPTPSPRRWPRRPWPRRRARCRSRSCAPRSSSRPWPSPARAGSGASAWPSR